MEEYTLTLSRVYRYLQFPLSNILYTNSMIHPEKTAPNYWRKIIGRIANSERQLSTSRFWVDSRDRGQIKVLLRRSSVVMGLSTYVGSESSPRTLPVDAKTDPPRYQSRTTGSLPTSGPWLTHCDTHRVGSTKCATSKNRDDCCRSSAVPLDLIEMCPLTQKLCFLFTIFSCTAKSTIMSFTLIPNREPADV